MPRTHRPSRGGIIKGGCSRGAGTRGVPGGGIARVVNAPRASSQEMSSEENVVLEIEDVRAWWGVTSLAGVRGFMFVRLC